MKKQIFPFIASFVLIVSVLLPISISFAHALHKHEHKVCTATSEHHIHKKNIDCSYFHYLSPVQTTPTTYTFEIFEATTTFENLVFNETFHFTNKLNVFTVRGPPTNNVF